MSDRWVRLDVVTDGTVDGTKLSSDGRDLRHGALTVRTDEDGKIRIQMLTKLDEIEAP